MEETKKETVNVELPRQLVERVQAYAARCPEVYKETLGELVADALETELDMRLDSSEMEYYEDIGRGYALKGESLPPEMIARMQAWLVEAKKHGRTFLDSIEGFFDDMPNMDLIRAERNKEYITVRREDYERLLQGLEKTLSTTPKARMDAETLRMNTKVGA